MLTRADKLTQAPGLCVLGVTMILVGSGCGSSSGSDTSPASTATSPVATTTTTTPSTTTTTTAEATTAAAAKPAPAPNPVPRPDLRARVRQNVIDINLFGEGKVKVETQRRGKKYDLLIYHELADNVTGGLMQRGAEKDAEKIMKNVYTGAERSKVQDVTVLATSELIDKLGNKSTGVAFSVSLPGAVGRRINWDNIDQIDIRDLWEKNVDLID